MASTHGSEGNTIQPITTAMLSNPTSWTNILGICLTSQPHSTKLQEKVRHYDRTRVMERFTAISSLQIPGLPRNQTRSKRYSTWKKARLFHREGLERKVSQTVAYCFPSKPNEPARTWITNAFLSLLEAPYPMQRMEACRQNTSLPAT